MARSVEHDPTDSSAQDEVEAKKAEAARLQREREVDDFKWLMSMKQGRRVMWRLLGKTKLHHTPHTMGASSEDNAFRAGEQNIGLWLQAEIHALCPEMYSAMVKEQREQREQNDRARKRT